MFRATRRTPSVAAALASLVVLVPGGPLLGQATAIVGATLIDGNGGPPAHNIT